MKHIHYEIDKPIEIYVAVEYALLIMQIVTSSIRPTKHISFAFAIAQFIKLDPLVYTLAVLDYYILQSCSKVIIQWKQNILTDLLFLC